MTDIIVPDLAEEQLGVRVTLHGDQTVLHFSSPREYVAMSELEPLVVGARLMFHGVMANDSVGEQAISLAMSLIDLVYEQRSDLKPAGGGVKVELVNRHRRKLVPRLTLMLNSLREQKTTSNADLARQIVEAVFHEVFA